MNIISYNLNNTSSDVDIYVSFSDGRKPSEYDYDYSSINYGSDTLIISSDDFFFTSGNYISNIGVFVIGIKALTANANYTISLY